MPARPRNRASSNIFMHPNVGPVHRQAADPEAGHRQSVAAVRRAREPRSSTTTGQGVRGDLKAVVTRDPHRSGGARRRASSIPAYGKLREPVLFMTGAARARRHARATACILGAAERRARPGRCSIAPSVFNYYPPTYVVPGHAACSGRSSRCRIRARRSTATTSPTRFAFGTIAPLATLPGATGTQPDWASLQAVAGDAERAGRRAEQRCSCTAR